MGRTTCTANVRVYAELNDFLPEAVRQTTLSYRFNGTPAVKDAIEALGVPHVAVDLLLVNGRSVGFAHRLHDGDRVAAYPVFESLDITALSRLRGTALRRTAFVADGHLGRLARLLRLLGFDTVLEKDAPDSILAAMAARDGRILLTRDRALLKRSVVTHGYWVRSTQPLEQAREVVRRFDLEARVLPFSRCLSCNGRLASVEKAQVLNEIPPRVVAWRNVYFRCAACGKVYWRGTHTPRLEASIAAILGTRNASEKGPLAGAADETGEEVRGQA